jgi:hypothetical protein
MSRRNIVVIAISALAAGMLVAMLLPATGQVTGKTFTLCEKDSRDYDREVDTDGDGEFSVGDMNVFSEPEFNTDGERVGRVFGTGTVIKTLERDGIVQINISAHLRGGDLELQSTAKFTQLGGGHPLAIVGGTGKYNDASGVVQIYGRGCKGVKGSTDHVKVVLN